MTIYNNVKSINLSTQNNPDLRLTWLESMAKNNEDHDHHAEAAMCKVGKTLNICEEVEKVLCGNLQFK